MNRLLAALGLLLAAACGGPSVRELALEQGRYDALDGEGLRALAGARMQIESGHAEEALGVLTQLRVQHPECVYLALWQQEAEIAARGLESVWPGAGGNVPPSSEQAAAIEELRALWRARAATGGVVECVAAARLENDAEAARALFERAEGLDPRCPWVPYGRAYLAARDNEWAEVRTQLDRSIALDPGHLPTFWLESWTKARGGSSDESRAWLAQWVERARGDPRIDSRLVQGAELDLSVLAVLAGEPKVARTWLDRLESQLPGDSRALCARASAELALGHVDEALALAVQAHTAAPNALLPLVQQALIRQHWQKDDAGAEQAWGEVLTLARASPEFSALFEQLRARIELERRSKEPAPAPSAP